MKKVIAFFTLGMGLFIGLLVVQVKLNKSLQEKYEALQTQQVSEDEEVVEIPSKEKEDRSVAKLVLLLMDQVNVDISEARRQIIVQTVVRVTGGIFKEQLHREHFAVLLAIESRFDNGAKSKVGAVGVAQVMPQFAKEFAKICAINDYKRSDLDDMELNMTIGACQFRALLESPVINGNVAAALVAYNAGKHSSSFKNLLRQRNIKHPEPPNYVARFTFLSEEVKKLSDKIEAELEKEDSIRAAKKEK